MVDESPDPIGEMAETQRTELNAHTSDNFPTSSDEGEPPSPPPKDIPSSTIRSPKSEESDFNTHGLSRTNSILTLSRASFSNQLTRLTSLNLPDAASLSSSVAAIPTAVMATRALNQHGIDIYKWIQEASQVVGGLDAEDDVEWASAGGKEGVGEAEEAFGRFGDILQIYVEAIEDLQRREDILRVPQEEREALVDRLEIVLCQWENVGDSLRRVKEQVDLAKEWEELWNVVFGDIGLEMESLGRIVYEMEEKRHKAMAKEPTFDGGRVLDIQELETIVEEFPLDNTSVNKASHRFSLPPGFSASSPIESPGMPHPQEESGLLALFARMQPLRASLDFLPMSLSGFKSRAEEILPSACEELDQRRLMLEAKWKKLEGDAEALRRELSEDRWVMAFRTAGRQIQKMCESVERSVSKLQEAIDMGAQHNNPAMLAKRIEAYEAKRTHYGSAVPRVLSMIEKGVKDRRTINGEILRLHADAGATWASLEADMRDMDLSLEDLNVRKNQQLRDSISSIVSNDISAPGSTVATPGSSPASSVVMSPAVSKKSFTSALDQQGSAHRSFSIPSASSTRPSTAQRNMRNPSLTRTATSSNSTARNISPHSPTTYSATPTPSVRPKRPSTLATDGKPRWNSSPKVDFYDKHTTQKLAPLKAPSPYANKQSVYSYRNSRSSSSNLPLPSPLGREHSASPVSSATSVYNPRSRHASGASSSLAVRTRRHTSPSPARASNDLAQGTPELHHVRLQSKYSTYQPPTRTASTASFQSHRPSNLSTGSSSDSFSQEYEESLAEESPTIRAKPSRPSTAMGYAGRRSSMLPVPKVRAASGRESSVGMRVNGK